MEYQELLEERDIFVKKPRGGQRAEFNLKDLYGKTGVYLIRENENLVYVGSSGNLGKRIARNFQKWEKRPYNYRDRINKNKYTVIVMLTKTVGQANILECEVMRDYSPRDNDEKDTCFSNELETPADTVAEQASDFFDEDIEVPF